MKTIIIRTLAITISITFILVNCKKKEDNQSSQTTTNANVASLTTTTISSVSATTAISGGNITSDGGSSITQRGICWGTTNNPTTANNKTNNGTGTGIFSSNLTGLSPNTTYYVRAYATNGNGTAYGNQLSFTTNSSSGNIISNPGAGVTFDGYTYSSIVLGNGQEWMAENLRTTKYSNGDPIPNVTDGTQWSSLTSGAWAHYNNDSQFEHPYGKLYNFFAVTDSRNLCPTGWHVPSDAEWSSFINYLDPNSVNTTISSQIAGGKMKVTGSQYWESPNTDATNETGFSGLPGGYRSNNNGISYWIGKYGYYWSTTNFDSSNNMFWSRGLQYNSSNSIRDPNTNTYGLSVRCLKD